MNTHLKLKTQKNVTTKLKCEPVLRNAKQSHSFYKHNAKLCYFHILFLSFFTSSSSEKIYKRHAFSMMSALWTPKDCWPNQAKCTIKPSFVVYIVPWEGTYAN